MLNSLFLLFVAWSSTFIHFNVILMTNLFNLVLSLVHGAAVLSKHLKRDGAVLAGSGANIPFNDSELNLVILQDVNAVVEELSIEQVTR